MYLRALVVLVVVVVVAIVVVVVVVVVVIVVGRGRIGNPMFFGNLETYNPKPQNNREGIVKTCEP